MSCKERRGGGVVQHWQGRRRLEESRCQEPKWGLVIKCNAHLGDHSSGQRQEARASASRALKVQSSTQDSEWGLSRVSLCDRSSGFSKQLVVCVCVSRCLISALPPPPPPRPLQSRVSSLVLTLQRCTGHCLRHTSTNTHAFACTHSITIITN